MKKFFVLFLLFCNLFSSCQNSVSTTKDEYSSISASRSIKDRVKLAIGYVSLSGFENNAISVSSGSVYFSNKSSSSSKSNFVLSLKNCGYVFNTFKMHSKRANHLKMCFL